MSDRRSWVERLSGSRSTSTAQPPSSRPEEGPGGPVRSNGPERTPVPGPGLRARPPAPEPKGAALRVVLVSRDNMLAGALRSLIEAPGGVRMLDWHSDELDVAIRHVDVVIVDTAPNLHERTFAVLAGRFLGRTVVLLQEGEHAEALPPGPPRVVLYRPLQIGELWAAVTGTPPPVDSAPPPEPLPEAGQVAPAPEQPEGGPGPAGPEPEGSEPEPEPEAGADQVAAAVVEAEGLLVAESGRLIGLSGRELEPVVGPGQIAPGMDEATFERLRRWGSAGRQPATAKPGTPARRRAGRATAGRAKAAAARRERSRRRRAARAEARQAARADAARVRAARAEARTTAREQSRAARATKARQRQAARDASRQARAAKAQERQVARDASRQAKAAKAEQRQAAREQARQAEAEARRVAAEASRQAKAALAAERAAAQEQARQAKEAQAAERAAAQEEAHRVKEAQAAERAAERAATRQAKAAEAARRATAEEEVRRAKAAQAAQRAAEQAEKRAARVAQAKTRRAERAATRRVARDESRQARAARAEVRKAARAEAARERAAQAEAGRERSRQEKAARAKARQVARERAEQMRAARAQERKVAREQARQAAAAQAEVRREESRRAAAARAEARKVAREEAARQRAARAEARSARRQEAGRARAAQAEARKVARAEAAQARAARAETRRANRAAQAELRKAARAEARRERAARAEVRRGGWAAKGSAAAARVGALVGGVAQVALIMVVMAALGVAAAGWRGGGGPDTLASEVAEVRAAGGRGGGLVVQDPRLGPVEPLHALAVGAWLRVTDAGTSLEGAVRDARVPSRFLLAGVVVLAMLLFLLLMRVGPGTGAAAGPGPAPPQAGDRDGRVRRRRLAGAALTGALVALDPLLVRSGRTATGTILAALLALGALALAWGLPARPALRRLPLVAAAGGLALLVSPLALPVLAVPVVAELLEGRYREAWRDMAAVAMGIGLWLVLPLWVAGQDLATGQAGWLLGRPPGRGPVAASLADAPPSWLLVAAGLVAAVLTWRRRSGARSDTGPGTARPLAWMATTAAGALVASALGFPAGEALAFATPAAAASLALAALGVAAPAASSRARWIGVAVGVALAGLLAAQAVDWGSRYGKPADDGLGRLVATVAAQVPRCSAVNAGGPDDRARLLAAGVTVTEFSSGPAAQAAGVRYFVLTGSTAQGGPMTPSLAAWVRQHGRRLAAQPSPTLSGIELWQVDAAPLDPVADNLPVPGGVFSNVDGSACGGYRVVDSQVGAFHAAYQDVGGKAVLGRPLGSVWTSDGPALQAFDTMVLGAVAGSGGPPAVRPIELPPLLAKLDVQAVAKADIPLPSARPPVTDGQARALLRDKLIARAYLGTDPATAAPADWRRARNRFGRPLGLPQTMPDGAVRQPFERVVLELPADGGPARPAALGQLAVRLGLVPKQAMRLEPVPGLPARPAETRLDAGPLLRPVGALLALLLLAAAAGAVAARRSGRAGAGEAAGGR